MIQILQYIQLNSICFAKAVQSGGKHSFINFVYEYTFDYHKELKNQSRKHILRVM